MKKMRSDWYLNWGPWIAAGLTDPAVREAIFLQCARLITAESPTELLSWVEPVVQGTVALLSVALTMSQPSLTRSCLTCQAELKRLSEEHGELTKHGARETCATLVTGLRAEGSAEAQAKLERVAADLAAGASKPGASAALSALTKHGARDVYMALLEAEGVKGTAAAKVEIAELEAVLKLANGNHCAALKMFQARAAEIKAHAESRSFVTELRLHEEAERRLRHDSAVTTKGVKRQRVCKEDHRWTADAERELVQLCDQWDGKGHKRGMNWAMVWQSLKDPNSKGRTVKDLENKWSRMKPEQKTAARTPLRESPFAAREAK